MSDNVYTVNQGSKGPIQEPNEDTIVDGRSIDEGGRGPTAYHFIEAVTGAAGSLCAGFLEGEPHVSLIMHEDKKVIVIPGGAIGAVLQELIEKDLKWRELCNSMEDEERA